VSYLQQIVDVRGMGEERTQEVIEKIQKETKLSTGGSKYSGFFANTDTIELYLRFMALPENYRAMDIISLKWGLDHFRSDWGGVSDD
jgi:hypothetical protein